MSFHCDRMTLVNIEQLGDFVEQGEARRLQRRLAGGEQELVGEHPDDEPAAVDHGLDVVGEAVFLGVGVELLLERGERRLLA